MNDYDVFVVPRFTLDTNYNYDIKLIVDKNLNKVAVFDKFTELGIKQYKSCSTVTKDLYYKELSCLVDIKKWLISLDNEFKLLGIRSNLDNKLVDKAKELKK